MKSLPRADNDNPEGPTGCRCRWITVTLVLSLTGLSGVALNGVVPGGLLPWLEIVGWALVRWPNLFALAGVAIWIAIIRWRSRSRP